MPSVRHLETLNNNVLSGQRYLKSLGSSLSTSIEQQNTKKAELSNFIEDLDTSKTPVEKKILKPLTASNGPQDDEAKSMFAEAVFNNCQFAFALDALSDGFETGEHSNLFQRKSLRESVASF